MKDDLALAKLLDQSRLCNKIDAFVFSDFLDPRTTGVFFESAGDTSYNCYGAERKMVGFAPKGNELKYTDFPIAALRIECRGAKFNKMPTHRDFLGAVLALGIERTKVGDIIIEDDHAIVLVHRELAAYVCANLEKVGRVSVKITEQPLQEDFEQAQKKGKEIRVTVPSLRLDAVLGSAFKLSRAEAARFIESEKVSVNWRLVTKTSYAVCEGDRITLRGQGRAHITEIAGKSKKDRIIVRITL